MLTRENQYEDLKVLYMDGDCNGSGVAESDGYDYMFAVRKNWLLEYMKSAANHEVTEDWLNKWLLEEYTSEDSRQIYNAAVFSGELVFGNRVAKRKCVKRYLYTVRDELRIDGEYEDQMYLQTTDKDEAIARFDAEVAKVKKEVKGGSFAIDGNGEFRSRISDGLPSLDFDDEDGNFYCLYVERTQFTDWRK